MYVCVQSERPPGLAGEPTKSVLRVGVIAVDRLAKDGNRSITVGPWAVGDASARGSAEQASRQAGREVLTMPRKVK